MEFFTKYFDLISTQINNIDPLQLVKATDMIKGINGQGGKIILAGNGGSAATASHVSVDLTKAAGIQAVNFNEADLITCFANDYGYEKWTEMAIKFYADKKDLVILISSSGKSLNIVNAALKAKGMNLPVITFSGFEENNPLRKLGNLNFWVNSRSYNIVEMTHHIWLVAIVDHIIGNVEYST